MVDQAHAPQSLAEQDKALRAKLPVQEKEQPDPLLQISTGRVGAPGLTLFAVIVVVILSVVMYGLNGRNSEGQAQAPAATAAAGTGNAGTATPAAPQSANKKNG